MKLLTFCCLALAIVPGCLLVQPLDDPKSDSSGGASAHAGSNGAGHTSSGGASGGAGPNGRAGAGGRVGAGGAAPSGGAPSGVDFSLFLGKWTLTAGMLTTDCGTGSPTTSSLTPGTYDTVTLGTTSDLIFDATTTCPITADVDDRTATALTGQNCTGTDTDSGNDYDIYYDAFTFVVGASGTTAQGTLELTTVVSTSDGTTVTCDQHEEITYTHTL